MNFLKNVVLFGVLTALCIAVPTNTITDQAVDPLNFNHPNDREYDSYTHVLERFNVTYREIITAHANADYGTADNISQELTEADLEEYEQFFKRISKRSKGKTAINPIDLSDAGTIGVGSQQLPVYFSLLNSDTFVPDSNMFECVGTPYGYIASGSKTGRTLNAFQGKTNYILFGPSTLEISTTIQGSTRLDNFGLGSGGGMVGFGLSSFVLMTTSLFPVQCAVAMGFNRNAFTGTTTYNGVVYPAAINFLAATAGAAVMGLSLSSTANRASARTYDQHIRVGAIDPSKFHGVLVQVPLSQSAASGRWALDGATTTIGNYNSGLKTYTASNKIGLVYFDNQNPFIMLPGLLVTEIYNQIPGKSKFATSRSGVANQWAIPCNSLPLVTFSFGLVTSTWAMSSAALVGRSLPASLAGVNMCIGNIQATVTGQFSVMGQPFFASIYTVFDYNSIGKGYTMSFAQTTTS